MATSLDQFNHALAAGLVDRRLNNGDPDPDELAREHIERLRDVGFTDPALVRREAKNRLVHAGVAPAQAEAAVGRALRPRDGFIGKLKDVAGDVGGAIGTGARAAEGALSDVGDYLDRVTPRPIQQFATGLGSELGATAKGLLELSPTPAAPFVNEVVERIGLPVPSPQKQSAEEIGRRIAAGREAAGEPKGVVESVSRFAGHGTGAALPFALAPGLAGQRFATGAAQDIAVGLGVEASESVAGTAGELLDSDLLREAAENPATRATGEALFGATAGALAEYGAKGLKTLRGKPRPPAEVSPLKERAGFAWRSGLLSRPRTLALNILDTASNIGLESVKDIPATVIERALVRGPQLDEALERPLRTKTLAGLGPRSLKRATGEAIEGGKVAARAVRRGEIPDTRFLEPGEVGEGRKTVRFKYPFVERVINLPFQGMGAADRAERGFRMAQSIEDQIAARAASMGLRGAEREAFRERLLKDLPEDIQRRAELDGVIATHQRTGDQLPVYGRSLEKINRAVQELPGGVLLQPFARTPRNVPDLILEYSPIGAFTHAMPAGRKYKQAVKQLENAPAEAQREWKTLVEETGAGGEVGELQRQFLDSLGRTATGTALTGGTLLGLSYLVPRLDLEDRITGAYPKSTRERNQWRLEGKQPYSIRIGDQWHTFRRFGVLAGALGATIDGWNRLKQDPESDLAERVQTFVTNLPKDFVRIALTEGSAVPTLAETAEKIRRGEEPLDIERTASGIVPGAVRTTAETIDPVVREREGIRDEILSGVPFASRQLDPRTNVLGEPLERGTLGQRLGATISPFYPRAASQDAAVREIARTGASVAEPGRLHGETDEAFEVHRDVATRMTGDVVGAAIASPEYQALNQPNSGDPDFEAYVREQQEKFSDRDPAEVRRRAVESEQRYLIEQAVKNARTWLTDDFKDYLADQQAKFPNADPDELRMRVWLALKRDENLMVDALADLGYEPLSEQESE